MAAQREANTVLVPADKLRELQIANANLRAEVEQLKADKTTAVEKMHESANQFVEFMHGPHSQVATERDELRRQLAASQLEAKRLRDLIIAHNRSGTDWKEHFNTVMVLLSSPTSTEALDAYVDEKVKEKLIEMNYSGTY